jgi:hypothetical protein
MARLIALASVAPKRLSHWPAINLRHVRLMRRHTAVYQSVSPTILLVQSHVGTCSVEW